MKKFILAFTLGLASVCALAQESVFEYKVTDDKGQTVSLSQYSGKVLLIVNTATRCGFTPQYKEMQAIYDKFASKGFVVLDFPCNQFGAQAPGSIGEINEFCTKQFATTFPRFEKIDVNGSAADPLFVFLKSQKGYVSEDPTMKKIEGFSKSVEGKDDIRWNFTKFLIDRDGKVVARFEPVDSMDSVEKAVENLL